MSARRVQHKTAREEAKVQEMRDMRKENQSLRKQVSRLRKQLEKVSAAPTESEETAEPEEPTITCPKCGSADVGTVHLPSGRSVSGCRSCKEWKQSQ